MPARPPLWLAAVLLLAAVWLGAHVLTTVTEALTAMTGADRMAAAPPVWPDRLAGAHAP